MRLKQVGNLLLALVVLFSIGAGSGARADAAVAKFSWVKLYVNNVVSKEKAYISQDQWMVPLQSVVQAARGTLKISGQNAVITLEGLTIEMTANQTEAKANGERIVLPSAPEKKIGRWYIRMSLVELLFGMKVNKAEGAAPSISIQTKVEKAFVYGYAADRNGSPIMQGTIAFCASSDSCDEGEVKEGYYRLPLTVGVGYSRAKLKASQANEILWEETIEIYPVELSEHESKFLRLVQSAQKVTIQVQYEDGTAVKSGSLEMEKEQTRKSYKIINGEVNFTITDKTQVVVYSISADGVIIGPDSVYARYNFEPTNEPITVKLVVHKANVHLKVKLPEGMKEYGSISLILYPEYMRNLSSESKEQFDPFIKSFPADNWDISIYLPDGKYGWSYTLYGANETYNVDQAIVVSNGKSSETVYVAELPNQIITGRVQAADGSTVSGGRLIFFKKGRTSFGREDASCPISQSGTYSVRLKDGEYFVLVYDNAGNGKSMTEHVIVNNGKANVTTLTYPSS